jgi:hypothetical protein
MNPLHVATGMVLAVWILPALGVELCYWRAALPSRAAVVATTTAAAALSWLALFLLADYNVGGLLLFASVSAASAWTGVALLALVVAICSRAFRGTAWRSFAVAREFELWAVGGVLAVALVTGSLSVL